MFGSLPQLIATGVFWEVKSKRRETRPEVVLAARRLVAPSSWIVPNPQPSWQSLQAAFTAPHEELQDDAGLGTEPAEHPLPAWNKKEAAGQRDHKLQPLSLTSATSQWSHSGPGEAEKRNEVTGEICG